MVAVGIAVDLSQGVAVEQKLAGTSDSIALAAARVYRDRENRERVGQTFLDGNMDNYGNGLIIKHLRVEFDDVAKIVTVTITAEVPTHLMSLVGIDNQTITTQSRVSYGGHIAEPVSLALVLDVSGSMRWSNKIGTLRTAAVHLLDQLKAADPDQTYVRTGLVTYSTGIRQSRTMDWGIDHTRPVVRALEANGGTASTAAVSTGGGWLRGNSERARHQQQPVHEGEEFELHRFMIFMTDGDNNRSSDDDATERHCDTIKADGVEIFSVAFEAPSRGRRLLQHCATSEEHYFDARDSREFLAAFEAITERIESSLVRIVE
jgi:uncharacterized protein YegL